MVGLGSANDPNTALDLLGYLPAYFSTNGGKTQVDPRLVDGERTGIFITAGQSIITNSTDTYYTPTNSRVHALSIYDGGMYFGNDPILGCTEAGGSMMGRLGDVLINAGIYDRVIFVAIAVSGSPISAWDTTGAYHWRWRVCKSRMDALGLTPTAILWEQGTADTVPAATAAGPTYWSTPFNSMMTAVRSYGFACPVFVAHSTVPFDSAFYTDPSVATIRLAQTNVLTTPGLIYAGADTDTIGLAYRDSSLHIHMTGAGAQIQAGLYKTAIDAVL